MRVSKGNRGGKGRQWGERTYAKENTTKTRKWPNKASGLTTMRMEIDWIWKDEKEIVIWVACCDNCGAKGSIWDDFDHKTHQRTGEKVCLCCGLLVSNPTQPN